MLGRTIPAEFNAYFTPRWKDQQKLKLIVRHFRDSKNPDFIRIYDLEVKKIEKEKRANVLDAAFQNIIINGRVQFKQELERTAARDLAALQQEIDRAFLKYQLDIVQKVEADRRKLQENKALPEAKKNEILAVPYDKITKPLDEKTLHRNVDLFSNKLRIILSRHPTPLTLSIEIDSVLLPYRTKTFISNALTNKKIDADENPKNLIRLYVPMAGRDANAVSSLGNFLEFIDEFERTIEQQAAEEKKEEKYSPLPSPSPVPALVAAAPPAPAMIAAPIVAPENKIEEEKAKDELIQHLNRYSLGFLNICRNAASEPSPLAQSDLEQLKKQMAAARENLSERENLTREWQQHFQPCVDAIHQQVLAFQKLANQLDHLCMALQRYDTDEIRTEPTPTLGKYLLDTPLGNLIEDLNMEESLHCNRKPMQENRIYLYKKIRELFLPENREQRLFAVRNALHQKIHRLKLLINEVNALNPAIHLRDIKPTHIEVKAKQAEIINYHHPADYKRQVAMKMQELQLKSPPSAALKSTLLAVKGAEAEGQLAILAIGDDPKMTNQTICTTGFNPLRQDQHMAAFPQLGKEIDFAKLFTTALQNLKNDHKMGLFNRLCEHKTNQINVAASIDFFRQYSECPPTETGIKIFLQIQFPGASNLSAIAKDLYANYLALFPETLQTGKKLADILINRANGALIQIKGPPFFKYIIKCYLEAVKQLLQHTNDAKKYEWVDHSDPMGAHKPKKEDIARALNSLVAQFQAEEKIRDVREAREKLRQCYSDSTKKLEFHHFDNKREHIAEKTQEFRRALL